MLRKFLFFLILPVYALCQDFPAKPLNYVTDGAGVLGPDEEYRLNAILKAFEDSTSIQLFVYTSPSLNGAVMADLSQKIFHEWKIGNKKTNNGILIAIFVNDHKFRIHTGYGMEGILPDLRTKKIQDEIMRPYFKENNYFMGLIEGVKKIMYYSKHEYKADLNKKGDGLTWLWIFAVNLLLYIIFMFLLHSRADVKNKTGLTIAATIALLVPFLGTLALCFLFLDLRRVRTRHGPYVSGSDNTFDHYSSSGGYSSYDSASSSDYSSSDSSFDGGGGGDSGGGGSDSDW